MLLQARLDEFQRRNPRVSIETRVKAVSGPGGLLDSLTTASAAAPQALPDLVALPRDLLETAALKGLLLPLDNLTTALDDPDWYAYAASLARLQKNIYGLPFAGDALVLGYHPNGYSQAAGYFPGRAGGGPTADLPGGWRPANLPPGSVFGRWWGCHG